MKHHYYRFIRKPLLAIMLMATVILGSKAFAHLPLMDKPSDPVKKVGAKDSLTNKAFYAVSNGSAFEINDSFSQVVEVSISGGSVVNSGSTKGYADTFIGETRTIIFAVNSYYSSGSTVEAIRIEGVDKSDFILQDPFNTSSSKGFIWETSWNVNSTNYEFFQVVFKPTALGPREATITLLTHDNDYNSNPRYKIHLTGNGLTPDIKVTGKGEREIIDGTTTTDRDDFTHMREVELRNGTTSKSYSFRIYNTGNADLGYYDPSDPATLIKPKVTIEGADADDFSAASIFTTIAPNAYGSLIITFDPSKLGLHNATVKIETNDPDESPFTFAISGTGVDGEIAVSGNTNVDIANGDFFPSVSDSTDFDQVLIGQTETNEFVVQNVGGGLLTLNNGNSSPISITGPGASDFSVVAQPEFDPPRFSKNTSNTFKLAFTPTGVGYRTATVNIPNDDADESPFTFNIRGQGMAPEINVSGNGSGISNGDTNIDFGNFDKDKFHTSGPNAGSLKIPATRTFTIHNDGNIPLQLGADAITITTPNQEFELQAQPPATIAAGGSQNFTVIFKPKFLGDRTAEISIANNDADESPFTFTVKAHVVDHKPSFDFAEEDIVLSKNAGAQVLTDFFNNATDGDFNTQGITFNLSNDNNALFDAQPAIINFPKIDQNNGDPLDFGLRRIAGDLSFTPKAGVYGKARVSLSITDDGGNTSDTKHVDIYVMPDEAISFNEVVVDGGAVGFELYNSSGTSFDLSNMVWVLFDPSDNNTVYDAYSLAPSSIGAKGFFFNGIPSGALANGAMAVYVGNESDFVDGVTVADTIGMIDAFVYGDASSNTLAALLGQDKVYSFNSFGSTNTWSKLPDGRGRYFKQQQTLGTTNDITPPYIIGVERVGESNFRLVFSEAISVHNSWQATDLSVVDCEGNSVPNVTLVADTNPNDEYLDFQFDNDAPGDWQLSFTGSAIKDAVGNSMAAQSTTLYQSAFEFQYAKFLGADGSFSVASQAQTPQAIRFANRGEAMYILDSDDNELYFYTLINNAYDVSQAVAQSGTFTLDLGTATSNAIFNPSDLLLNDVADRIFVLNHDPNNGIVAQLDLTSRYLTNTAVYNNVKLDFSSRGGSGTGMAFNTHGTKLYIIVENPNKMYEYVLSTPYDLSTASFSHELDLSALSFPRTPLFNRTGSRLYIHDLGFNEIMAYDLNTSFDISTAVKQANPVLEIPSTESSGPLGITFNEEGAKLYVVGGNDDKVVSYSLDDSTPPKMVSGVKDSETQLTIEFSENVKATGGVGSDFIVKDGLGNVFTVSNILSSDYQSSVSLEVADLSNAVGDLSVIYVANNNLIQDFACNTPLTDAVGVIVDADVTAPKVVSFERHLPNQQNTNADELTFKITFSEPMKNVDAADFQAFGSFFSVNLTPNSQSITDQGNGVYLVTFTGGDITNFDGVVHVGFSTSLSIEDYGSNHLGDVNPTSGKNEYFNLDNTAPTVTNVTIKEGDGQYRGTQIQDIGGLTVQVTFSEEISVTGVPKLTLETGPNDQSIAYSRTLGNKLTIEFKYNSSIGDINSDLDYVSTTSLLVGSGVNIKDLVGNSANLSLPTPGTAGSISANKDIDIDFLPKVGLSFSKETIEESTDTNKNTANIEVSLVDGVASTTDVTVNLAYGGTATAGSDYNSNASTSITIPAGSLTAQASIPIQAINDTDPELPESISVEIVNVVNGYEDGTQQDVLELISEDPIRLNIDSPDVFEGNSGTTTLTFTVSGNFPAPDDITMGYAVTGGTADAADFTSVSGTLKLLQGEQSKTIDITVMGDEIVENHETIELTISNASSLGFINVGKGTGTIKNDESVRISPVAFSESEDGAFVLSVTADKAVDGGFSVDVVTFDFQAIAGDDYTALNETINFVGTAGETHTVTVTVNDDDIVERDEAFTLALTNKANYKVRWADVKLENPVRVTIENNDVATVSIADVTVNEGDGTATATLTLDKAVSSGFDVFVSSSDVSAKDNSDYTAVQNAKATFVGNAGETQTISFNVTDDNIVESSETFTLILSSVVSSSLNNDDFDLTDEATVTIIDNDAATLAINDVTMAENANGATTGFTFSVTLTGAVQEPFTLQYATNLASARENDFTATDGTLSFTGNNGEAQTFDVTVLDDDIVEVDEFFNVLIHNVVAPGRNITISDATAKGTITNDDQAIVTVADIGYSEDGTFVLALTADKAVDGGFTVDVSTKNNTAYAPADYTALVGETVTFAGTAGETQTVTLSIVNDEIVEADETFDVCMHNLTPHIVNSGSISALGTATVTIQNNDVATVSIADVSVSEDGGPITLTATLNKAVDGGLSVDVNTVDGTAVAVADFIAITSQTLNFAGTVGETQTFTVTLTDDNVEESTETLTIAMNNLVTTIVNTVGVDIMNFATITITNDDDNTAPVGYTVTIADALIGGSEVSTSTFTFVGAEVGTTYNYTVSSDNGGTNVTGSGTIATATDQVTLADLSGLNDGTLTLSVTLTDASSNVGTAATDDTVLDTTAPVAPIVTSVSDDTGSSASDGITSDNTPSVNGTAEANATVEVFVGGTSVGTATADASGDWTLAYTGVTPLTDGTIAVTANATDAAGNTGANSTAVNVTIDTTAPAAATFNGITNDTGASSTDAIINDMSSVTISGTAEANATFDLTFNGTTFSGLTVDGSGNWSMDISNALTEDATETVTVTITDAAGNTSAAATYDITLDITAPEAPAVDLDATSDKGTSDSDDLTNYTIGDAMTFSGTAEASASVEVELTYNGTTFTGLPATTDGSGNWSIDVGSTIGGVLVDGTVNDLTLRAMATDVAGNVGTAGELTIVLDQALDATLTPADNATDVLPNANLMMNFSEDVYKGTGNITIKQSSDNTVLETIDVTSANVVVSGAEVTIDPTSLLLPPSEEFYVTVDAGTFTDDAGNSYVGISNNTAWTFTIIAAPVVTSVSVPAADTYGIGDELEFTVNFTLPVNTSGSLSLPITLGASAKEATVAADASNSNSLTFSYTIAEGDLDTDGIAIGSNINLNGGSIVDQFATNAILALNNVASTAAINVDGIRAIPTLSTATGSLTNEALTVTVTYDEQVTGLELTDFTIANGTASDLTVVTAGLVWTATVTPSADGAVSVTLPAGTVNDQAGNTSAASANTISTTFDGTAPTVSSIARAEADQLNTADTDANFTVTFSEEVTGVDVADFETVVTGTATASINSVTAVDAKTYTVNVNGISGEGTIGLNLKANSSILDAATNALTADYTGDVYTTNYLPTAIGLSSSSIDENSAAGSVVGTIASTDQDATDSHTYTLVAGTGDADNASFSINGDQLLTAEVFDFETKDSYSIRVKTDDGFGGTFEQVLTITVDNVLESSITITGEEMFEETVLGFTTSKTW
ncbi:choice-of-anchor D domain-containing protein, partial [Roseivirga pacifica]|uniref:Calx-beta domain-containing protein n=3 Tax=Roseivirga pacifica TaxID=1267423 RepID=UPI002095B12A